MGGFGHIAFSPALPWWALAGLAAPAAAIIGLGLWRRARGTGWRALAAAALLLALTEPTLVSEQRRTAPDIAIVIADHSPSMKLGARAAQRDAALDRIRRQAARLDDLELRVVEAGGISGSGAGADTDNQDDTPVDGTHLFAGLDRAMSDLPRQRVASSLARTKIDPN